MNEKSNLHQVEHERVMHYKYLIMFLRILSMHRCQDHYMGSPKAGGTMINPFSHFKRINSPHTSIHPSFLSTLPSSWVKVQLSFVVLSLSAPLQSLRGLVLDWGRARVGGNVGEIEQVLPPPHSLQSPSLPASWRRGSQSSGKGIRGLDQKEERPFSPCEAKPWIGRHFVNNNQPLAC